MSLSPTALPAEISSAEIDKVFSIIDIPSCPAIVAKVLAEVQKDNPDIRMLAQSISADAGMAAASLRLANSPLFRAGKQTSSVLEAIERLGMRNISCVIIATALKSSMSGISGESVNQFWIKASSIALAAGMIAKRQFGVAPDAAYTYALFHNAGQPLMMQRFPEYPALITECRNNGRMLISAEDQYFPCTHPIIGSLLVRNWGLAPLVGLAIRFHHEPDVYYLPDQSLPGGAVSLIAVTHIAEFLSDEMDCEPDLEVGAQNFQRALEHFGIELNELDELRDVVSQSRQNDAS